MLIRVDDPALVADLCAHFRRAGFSAQSVGSRVLDVERPDAPTDEQACNEIEVHLQVWRAINPGSDAELLPA